MNKREKNIALSSGTLHLWIESEKVPLEKVSCFASRRNNRRGFLFVSKVLGKHYPVAPQAMRRIYQKLAEEITPVIASGNGNTTCLAMAETATGFGAGIYEELCKTAPCSMLFGQSTRYCDSRAEILLSFQEPHSHATGHFINGSDQSKKHLATSTTLILLDDEQSTGTTAQNAVAQLLPLMPKVEQVVVVSILNWMGQDRINDFRSHFDALAIHFPALISGTMQFTPHPDFHFEQLPQSVGRGEAKDLFLAEYSGRRWYSRSPSISQNIVSEIAPKILRTTQTDRGRDKRPILVLGTGEFTFLPFLLAEALEKRGEDLLFQSTTRSPILVEQKQSCINHGIHLEDNYDEGVMNFVYNLIPDMYRAIVICYETEHNKNCHQLPDELAGAHKIVLEETR